VVADTAVAAPASLTKAMIIKRKSTVQAELQEAATLQGVAYDGNLSAARVSTSNVMVVGTFKTGTTTRTSTPR
jgi:hypothetical protein